MFLICVNSLIKLNMSNNIVEIKVDPNRLLTSF